MRAIAMGEYKTMAIDGTTIKEKEQSEEEKEKQRKREAKDIELEKEVGRHVGRLNYIHFNLLNKEYERSKKAPNIGYHADEERNTMVRTTPVLGVGTTARIL